MVFAAVGEETSLIGFIELIELIGLKGKRRKDKGSKRSAALEEHFVRGVRCFRSGLAAFRESKKNGERRKGISRNAWRPRRWEAKALVGLFVEIDDVFTTGEYHVFGFRPPADRQH